MKTVELTKSRRGIAHCVSDAQGDLVLLTREGKLVAAIVPVADDDDAETVALKLNPRFIAMLERSRRSLAEEGGIPFEQIRAEFGSPEATT